MKLRLSVLFCSATLIILAAATPAAAGQLSFGFSFGYPGYPAIGYFGYYSPPPYVYRVYAPPVVYPAPVVGPTTPSPIEASAMEPMSRGGIIATDVY